MSFKQFKEFSEKAQTRCGAAFKIISAQQNMDDVITAVKGLVYLPDEQNEGSLAEVNMLWNLKGQAMLIGDPFDLIIERPVSELSEDAAILVSPIN
jgi:hypothetical protein